jgi:hypothetical protein
MDNKRSNQLQTLHTLATEIFARIKTPLRAGNLHEEFNGCCMHPASCGPRNGRCLHRDAYIAYLNKIREKEDIERALGRSFLNLTEAQVAKEKYELNKPVVPIHELPRYTQKSPVKDGVNHYHGRGRGRGRGRDDFEMEL